MLLKRFNIRRDENDPAKIEELKRSGFIEVAPAVREEQGNNVLEKLSKAKLVELAKEQGIKTQGLKKDELIQALNGR